MSAALLWQRLQAEGLVEGDYEKPARVESPWFVRVMLGVAGWIGAIFLLLFVGAGFAFIMNDAFAAVVLGLTCCGGALALFRAFDGNDFAEQFALAVSIAGQVLIVIGLGQTIDPDQAGFFLFLAAIEAMLVVANSNFLHRVLAAAAAAVALALGIAILQLHGLAAPILCLGLAMIWLEPGHWAVSGRLWRPVGYGFVLALLLVETFRLFDMHGWFGLGGATGGGMAQYGPWIGRALTGAILVWAAFTIASRESGGPGGRVPRIAAAAAAVFALLALPAPGLASAVLILLLGFAAGNRLLAALGILALLGFVSHYYYSLHVTLLTKSGLLAITGLVLLAAYFALGRFAQSGPAAETGHA